MYVIQIVNRLSHQYIYISLNRKLTDTSLKICYLMGKSSIIQHDSFTKCVINMSPRI